MAINPPASPENDEDTPQWVKDLFGRLTDKIEKLEEKSATPQPQSEKEIVQPPDAGNDKPEPERKPARRKSWAFRK